VRGMRTDFSWRASARAYEDLYAAALADLRSGSPV
jgi:glycogen synthase